ncbi:unnamed protein product [Calypogeia fissa]
MRSFQLAKEHVWQLENISWRQIWWAIQQWGRMSKPPIILSPRNPIQGQTMHMLIPVRIEAVVSIGAF